MDTQKVTSRRWKDYKGKGRKANTRPLVMVWGGGGGGDSHGKRLRRERKMFVAW